MSPCIGKYNTCGAMCDKLALRTPEEIAAETEEMNKRMENLGVARKAIVAACGGPWKKGSPSKKGKIDCPVCQKAGTLHFSRAGYNGHIHAQCETAKCVSWIE